MAVRIDSCLDLLLPPIQNSSFAERQHLLLRNLETADLADLIREGISRGIPRGEMEHIAATVLNAFAPGDVQPLQHPKGGTGINKAIVQEGVDLGDEDKDEPTIGEQLSQITGSKPVARFQSETAFNQLAAVPSPVMGHYTLPPRIVRRSQGAHSQMRNSKYRVLKPKTHAATWSMSPNFSPRHSDAVDSSSLPAAETSERDSEGFPSSAGAENAPTPRKHDRLISSTPQPSK
ncbi:hypothetical protein NX059_006560 [Plenodomus lindquistii]|nr:hypothetical protein NX059_006560 [Plenodomus lindquistii]